MHKEYTNRPLFSGPTYLVPLCKFPFSLHNDITQHKQNIHLATSNTFCALYNEKKKNKII